ncbi:MAG: GEVED domain-containing protein [Chloroflexota bacterium]
MKNSRPRILIAMLVGASLACDLLTGGAPTSPPATALPTSQPTLTAPPSAPTADYGDAPDPGFPSLFASRGAHTLDINQFWLGNFAEPSATTEPDARVVNADELDDGLEKFTGLGATAYAAFRAVKSRAATDGNVYFNLLVDLNGDGEWQGQTEWVVANREVHLTPGASELIETPIPPASLFYVWMRAALTDTPVDAAAFSDGWDGTGEFAQGEVEDYFLTLLAPPPPTDATLPPPTTSTPTPTPRIVTSGPPRTPATPTLTATPKGVYTGDFVIVCDPEPAAILHGESVTVRFKITGGENTPPDRFQVLDISGLDQEDILAGKPFKPRAAIKAVPPPGQDGWSVWGEDAGFTYASLNVDGPERVEEDTVWVTFQSRSTTKVVICRVVVKHIVATPVPTPTATPTPPKTVLTLDVFPRRVSLGGAVSFTGDGFTPNGQVTKTFVRPDGSTFEFQATADAFGVVIGSLTIPKDQPTGVWTVTATDIATGRRTQATFTVVP